MHCLFVQQLDPDQHSLVIEGDEAKHAIKVKRLAHGELLRLLDGHGTVATARVTDTRGRLGLTIERRELAERVRPAVHVFSATPKGPRVEELVDALVQVGAASWSPMQTKLGVVDPRESKLSRLGRISLEATKQAQRPWMMTMGEKRDLAEVLRDARQAAASLVIADATGTGYTPTGAQQIWALIGPEGGFMPEEIRAAREAGAQIVNLGPHVMRIEVAAPVAAALIIASERGAG